MDDLTLEEAAQYFLESVVYECDTVEDRADIVRYGNALRKLLKVEDTIPELKMYKRRTHE